MASFNEHNLCVTIEPRYRYETQRCAVGHAIQPWQNGGRTWCMSHKWSDHAGGYDGGRCENCDKTIKEVRIRVHPVTGKPMQSRISALARSIARMHADVPEIKFTGGMICAPKE